MNSERSETGCVVMVSVNDKWSGCNIHTNLTCLSNDEGRVTSKQFVLFKHLLNYKTITLTIQVRI